MKHLLLIFSLLFSLTLFAQEERDPEAGKFQLGMRTTVSAFGQENAGMGIGGQFRIKFGERLNTEWFADYITNDISSLGRRTDAHIGWSVMFYPLNVTGKLVPYILAGHCFDYTKVLAYNNSGLSMDRWSSAVQMGLGTHFKIADNFDISLSSQYMSHLGNDIHTHTDEGRRNIIIEQHKGFSLEGHVLTTLSLNLYIADLW